MSDLDYGVLPVLGSGKMGKSSTLHYLIDRFFPDRAKVFYDPMDFNVSAFPGYKLVHTVEEIPDGAVAILEDVNRTFPSRGSNTKSELPAFLSLISQRDQVVAFSTQNFGDTDLSFIRSQNVIFVHKFMHNEDITFERPELQEQQVYANLKIQKAAEEHPEYAFRSFAYVPRYNETISVPLLSWWSRKNSHMFARGVVPCQ